MFKRRMATIEVASLLMFGAWSAQAHAQSTQTMLHAFTSVEGRSPNAGLVELSDGTFYGTTEDNAFRFNPCGEFKVLVPFGNSDQVSSGLIKGIDGNLYGAAARGGSSSSYGYLFKLSPLGKVDNLHIFEGTDGSHPTVPYQAADGTFYGVTGSGTGNYNYGSVYKLSAGQKPTTLFGFSSPQATSLKAGYYPYTSLIGGTTPDTLYGATAQGGANNGGVIFKITTGGEFSVFASFGAGSSGSNPHSLILGADGTIYGRTETNGGSGAIFGVASTGAISTLHGFTVEDGTIDVNNNYYNGYASNGKLILGKDGKLYGIAEKGGANGFGTVYSLATDGTFNVLYAFKGGVDGGGPTGLVQGSDGNLYGTASSGGGSAGTGGIFRVTLPGATVAGSCTPVTSTPSAGTGGDAGAPTSGTGGDAGTPSTPGTNNPPTGNPTGSIADAGRGDGGASPTTGDAATPSTGGNGGASDAGGEAAADKDDGCNVSRQPGSNGLGFSLVLALAALVRRRRRA